MFQRRLTSDDGMGGQTPDANGWQTVGTAWGQVTALDERHRETLTALKLEGRAAYHVDIAHRAGIEPKVPGSWRIVWGGRTLEFQSAVDDTGRKRRLVLLCVETAQE